MKHLIRILTLALVLDVLLATPIHATSQNGTLYKQHICQYKSQYKQIYHTMKKSMTKAPITGNATEDFLYEMIPHHQAAIAMSQNILRYTTDAKVKSLAQDIITEQVKGVSQMKALLKQLEVQPNSSETDDEAYLKDYKAILNTMLTQMAKPSDSCDVNVLFLETMIPHHEGAIAMAENILRYTTNPELKEIATHIVSSQSTQLPQMQSLLQTLSK